MHSQLQQLGLSKDEAQVFIALLELGTSAASIVAKKAKVPRVNCYHILDNLISNGQIIVLSSKTRDSARRYLQFRLRGDGRGIKLCLPLRGRQT